MSVITLPKGFTIVEHIGTVGFGSVYLISDGQKYFAIKIIFNAMANINNQNVNPHTDENSILLHQQVKRLAREVNVCKHFQECYEFVGYDSMYRAPKFDNNLYIVMDYQKHTLRKVIDSNYDNPLSEAVIRLIIAQLLCGLHKMHSKNCSHRDISPKNILIDVDNCRAYICDFGLAHLRCPVNSFGSSAAQPYNSTDIGTLPYIAPEILFENRTYNPTKVDIWSVGILLIEMLLGYFPGANKDPCSLLVFLFTELIEFDPDYWNLRASQSIWRYTSPFHQLLLHPKLSVLGKVRNMLSMEGFEVLRNMLMNQAERRPPCLELLQMDWFTKDKHCHELIQRLLQKKCEPEEELLPNFCQSTSDEEATAHYVKYLENAVPILDVSQTDLFLL